MQRRTLVRWFLSALAAVPLSRVRVWAQATSFPGTHDATLRALAETVLPASLGASQQHARARAFVTWVREYREGAELEHGYGAPRLRRAPASPAAAYERQLAELDDAARAAGGSFGALTREKRRPIVEAALERAGVQDLPGRPDGTHVATDLMAHFFRGADANDLCHGAAIGRGRCRSLEGSERPPTPLTAAR